jgi:hypothetical protein
MDKKKSINNIQDLGLSADSRQCLYNNDSINGVHFSKTTAVVNFNIHSLSNISCRPKTGTEFQDRRWSMGSPKEVGAKYKVTSKLQSSILYFANCEMSQCKWAGLKKVSTMHK